MKIFKNWTFKWWEVSLIKISCISLGIILGLCYQEELMGLRWLWWTLVIVAVIYFIPWILKKK